MENYLELKKGILDDNNNDRLYLHCPECIEISLFGVKIINNEIYIQYKCRKNHKGQLQLSEFLNQSKQCSIETMVCKYCNRLNDKMKYCYNCNNAICNKCLINFYFLNHKKITEVNEYNSICSSHFFLFTWYCKKCNLPLCIKCPNYHLNHDLCHISNFDYFSWIEKIKIIENKFKEIKKERNDIIIEFENYIKKFQLKLLEFKKNTELEIHFFENLIISKKINNKKCINVESIENLLNLKYKRLNFKNDLKFPEIFEKKNNILDSSELNFEQETIEKNVK